MPLFGRKPDKEDKYNLYTRDRIREARHDRGLTQEELANRIHWSRVAVSDLERGRTRINLSDLLVIARALEKPVAHFLPGQTTLEGELSPKEMELVHFFRGIQNEALEDLLIKQAEQFADVADDARYKAEIREMDETELKGNKPKDKK